MTGRALAAQTRLGMVGEASATLRRWPLALSAPPSPALGGITTAQAGASRERAQ